MMEKLAPNTRWKLCFTAVVILTLYSLSLYVFSSGFLLSRTEIYEFSNCTSVPQRNSPLGSYNDRGCWVPQRFERAIIVLIDALRYDFATRIPIIAELTQQSTRNSFLKRFVADPPTTTLQRLKALTTGSLPTFIDAGANFGGDELLEDSWIRQLVNNGRRIAFVGDDTWTQLFPAERFFARIRPSNSTETGKHTETDSESKQVLAFGFPSFNVHDLDTVDSAIRERMPKLLQSAGSTPESDWDVLIMHFLGVDHAGHRFGANHPEMRRKLSEMNAVLADLSAFVDKSPQSTVLLAFGDHGMTDSGDHGGDARDEVDSALFAYSNRPFLPATTIKTSDSAREDELQTEAIAQVDLVPSVSLLLGVPVPFSSLGCLITDLFGSTGRQNQLSDAFELARALEANAQQVNQYLRSYSSRRGGALQEKALLGLFDRLHSLNDRFDRAAARLNSTSVGELHEIARGYVRFLRESKALCGAVWSTFQLGFMAAGLLSFGVTLWWHFLLHRSEQNFSLRVAIGCHLVTLSTTAVCVFNSHRIDEQLYVIVSVIGGVFTLLVTVCSRKRRSATAALSRSSWRSAVYCLPVVLYCASLASNSYIVNEAQVALFLLQTTLCAGVLTQLHGCLYVRGNNDKRLRSKRFVNALKTNSILLFVALFATRCAVELQTCREEQSENWCSRDFFLKQTSTFTFIDADMDVQSRVSAATVASKQNFKFWFSLLCAVGIFATYRAFLSRNGHLFSLLINEADSSRAQVFSLLIRYCVPFQIILVCAYDALQFLPKSKLDALLFLKQVFIPRAVYTISAFLMLMVVNIPFYLSSVRVLPRARDQRLMATLRNSVARQSIQPFVRSLFNDMYKPNGSDEPAEEQPTAVIYGLATLLSASLLTMMLATAYPLLILAGLQYAPAFLYFFVAAFCIVELNQQSDSSNTNVSILQLFLLGSLFFYSFGLQPTLTNIRWNAAFVGYLSANTSTIQQGSLIMLSTFGASLLVALIITTFTTRQSRDWLLLDSLASEVRGWFAWLGYDSAQQPESPEEEEDKKKTKRKQEESVAEEETGVKVETAELGEAETAYFTPSQPQCVALPRRLGELLSRFVLLHAIILFAMMVVVTVHRRHLFVWKIFAPRFIYQALNFACTATFSLSVFCTTGMIHSRLVSWYNEQLLGNMRR